MKENQWREMVVGDGEGGLTEKLSRDFKEMRD